MKRGRQKTEEELTPGEFGKLNSVLYLLRN